MIYAGKRSLNVLKRSSTMRIFLAAVATCLSCLGIFAAPASGAQEETVLLADQVLHEIMAIPAKRIPERLLADAQGIVIIPDVIKVGFIGGIRRGHGVVLVRDAQGEWSLPQFVVLTGGSVGFQAGIQATDVILVFRTKKSVAGLLNGKCTIGADASVAAGPIGRSAEAATDGWLQAEILSWSRSRGIFAGAALDGSVIEIDQAAHAGFYGAPPMAPPGHIPASAIRLLQDVAALSHTTAPATSAMPPDAQSFARVDMLRRALSHNASTLYALLDAPWRQYLTLPYEVFSGTGAPRVEDLQRAVQQYDRVARSPEYTTLAQRPEFQATFEQLREYTAALTPVAPQPLALPAPPVVTLPPQGR
jgi:lipid-binding SYLF domain-containing protein